MKKYKYKKGYDDRKQERENKVWQLKEKQEDLIICISIPATNTNKL